MSRCRAWHMGGAHLLRLFRAEIANILRRMLAVLPLPLEKRVGHALQSALCQTEWFDLLGQHRPDDAVSAAFATGPLSTV